ncbi:MAG TPA: NAD-dependent epimerase/dehydratase family protein, partial [Sphingobacteriaceae bacterium]
ATPFAEDLKVDTPVSIYAATKKTNELLAYTYSHLFDINTIGLRFFTVYGPYGRPDMAYFSFTKSILSEEAIKVFNGGNLSRDFTYIEDIIEGISQICNKLLKSSLIDVKSYEIYNIGNSRPVKLMDFIYTLEKALDKRALIEFVPMQAGDVHTTYADVSKLKAAFGYAPSTTLEQGITKFVKWYKEYYVE